MKTIVCSVVAVLASGVPLPGSAPAEQYHDQLEARIPAQLRPGLEQPWWWSYGDPHLADIAEAALSHAAAVGSPPDARSQIATDVVRTYLELRALDAQQSLLEAQIAVRGHGTAGRTGALAVLRSEGVPTNGRREQAELRAEMHWRTALIRHALRRLAILTGSEPSEIRRSLPQEGEVSLPPWYLPGHEPVRLLAARRDLREAATAVRESASPELPLYPDVTLSDALAARPWERAPSPDGACGSGDPPPHTVQGFEQTLERALQETDAAVSAYQAAWIHLEMLRSQRSRADHESLRQTCGDWDDEQNAERGPSQLNLSDIELELEHIHSRMVVGQRFAILYQTLGGGWPVPASGNADSDRPFSLSSARSP